MRKNTKGLVYIQGPAFYWPTAKVFVDYGFDIVDNIYKADIVCLTGGEDISPSIYHEKPIKGVYWDDGRDKIDLRSTTIGLEEGKFLVGICRGAQLLCCYPNEGSLWQDVNGHGSGYHKAVDVKTGKEVNLITVHHQQMRPKDGQIEKGVVELLTYASVSTYKTAFEDKEISVNGNKLQDIEALWYPYTKSLCVQFHPEFGHTESTQYFYELMDRYYK